jgi:hypothetical protein
MTDNQLFWVKMFAPRSKKYMREHLKALKKGVSHFETPEENQDKQTALKSLLK